MPAHREFRRGIVPVVPGERIKSTISAGLMVVRRAGMPEEWGHLGLGELANGAPANIAAAEAVRPVDPVDGGLGSALRHCDRAAERGDAERPPARRHQAVIALGRARVEDGDALH